MAKRKSSSSPATRSPKRKCYHTPVAHEVLANHTSTQSRMSVKLVERIGNITYLNGFQYDVYSEPQDVKSILGDNLYEEELIDIILRWRSEWINRAGLGKPTIHVNGFDIGGVSKEYHHVNSIAKISTQDKEYFVIAS